MLSSLAKAASGALAAASSAMAGTGLPFETGDEHMQFAGLNASPWKMHAGKKDGQDVSIFLYDLKNKKSEMELAQVRNAAKKMRTIKHPYMLKCLDAGENLDQKGGGVIWVVTEPVQPLVEVLDELQERLGWPRRTVPAGYIPGLDKPLTTIDFSDFLVICNEDLPDDVAHLLSWAMCETKEILERQYRHLAPERSPVTYPLDPSKIARTTIPLHDGARRYYEEAGHLR